MTDNVILIGMPGAGKSSLGIVLAKVMGFEFVDSDLLIQKKAGKLLWQIIEDDGIEKLLALEEEVVSSLEARHCVIAPGGSVVYSEKAMKHLKELGTVVYLEAGYETLKKRIGNFETRGIIIKVGRNLIDIYNERLPLYEKYADITIHQDSDNISKTIADVVAELDAVCPFL